jgi:Tetratricopeptide repeat
VTTRRRDAALASGVRQLIEVGLYTPGQALAYLREKTGDGDGLEQAADLAADLGYLPLALAQAAAYLHDRQETYAGYRCRLRDRRKRLSELFPDDALADDYRSTVAATWSISLEAADRLLPPGLATPVLRLASTLDPNGAPIEVFTSPAALAFLTDQHQSTGSAGTTARVDGHDCRDALSHLHRLNLISVDRGGGPRAVRTHALVQRATLDQLPADTLAATVRSAADAVLAVWPEIERDTSLGQALRDCTMVLTERHGALLWAPDGHPVLFQAGWSLGECGLVSAAVHYWTQMITDATDALGPDHPDTLAARGNLALWRGEAGDLAGAAAAFEELLGDYLRVSGADHSDTLATRRHLARLRGEAGAAAAFEELFDDCLRVLGADHLLTLITRDHLARCRGEAGDPVGAAAAFEELLSDRLRVLGGDHPHTLITRHSLALWRGVAGDPVGAAAAFEELLSDRLRVLGADHPHTLDTRQHLANYRGVAGDPVGAAAAFEELLSDRLRVLGADHPDTLTTRSALAHWRGRARDQGELR